LSQNDGRRRAPRSRTFQASRRHTPAAGGRAPVSKTRVEPYAALDQALAAAAAAPAPEPVTFAELGVDPAIVRALAVGDIHEPFAIQSRALPDALAGRNILGRARTGSGKTLAFGLAMLTRLAATPDAPAGGRKQRKAPRGLILVPTRELAKQVADVLAPLGGKVGLSVAAVYGGVPIGPQIAQVRDADIVVATPGRLLDLIDRHACTLADVEISVVDEADQMSDLGFLPPVTKILGQTPADGQRMLFSATLDRGVGKLVADFVADPTPHAVPDTVGDNLTEHTMLVLAAQDKVPVAAQIASRPGRTLFFVRTRHGAERLAKQFNASGVTAAAIHGDRNQSQRQRALDAFAAGHPRVLVATDVAARGIHVDDVDMVVQFDPPADHKGYLHRSGRTARAGASGRVVALVEHGQLHEVQRLHHAAGITADTHEVVADNHVVRTLAASGDPVPPAPRTLEHPASTARRSSATTRSGRTGGSGQSRRRRPDHAKRLRPQRHA
jgi:superfamily II DNA/RNA helicase